MNTGAQDPNYPCNLPPADTNTIITETDWGLVGGGVGAGVDSLERLELHLYLTLS